MWLFIIWIHQNEYPRTENEIPRIENGSNSAENDQFSTLTQENILSYIKTQISKILKIQLIQEQIFLL
jgi:hypothetical protein